MKFEVAITEKQILHLFIDNPSLLREDIDFISDIGKEFYFILLELKKENFDFLLEHIIKQSKKLVDISVINSVYSTEYQLDKLDTYIKELQTNDLLSSMESKILKEVSKKGTKDVDKLKELYNEFGSVINKLDTITSKEKKELNFYDLLVEHKQVISNRSRAIRQTTGCFNLDKVLPVIIPGIVLITGYSGSAKSTYSHYLMRQRLIKRLPTISVNTELSKVGVMDGLIPSLINVPYYDILGIDNNDMIDYNHILEEYDKLIEKYKDKEYFKYLNKYSCSSTELNNFIISSRRNMKMKDETTLFCFVDLFSMMSDFNDSTKGYAKAEVINTVLDKVNEVCLRTNTLLIGTVQLKRRDELKKITKIEDIETFRPNLSSIKSSGAWEERARLVLSLHNPWSIVHKNPCDELLRLTIDSVVELDTQKDTYFQQAGTRIKYLYQSDYKTFMPYFDENKEDEE